MRSWGLRLLLILLVQAVSSPAAAQSRSTSYSVWELGGETVQLRVRMDEIDLTRLQLHPDYTPNYAQQIHQLLQQGLQLSRAGQSCAFNETSALRRQAGQVIAEAGLTCGPEGEYSIRSELLLAPLPSHLHFAQVVWPDGSRIERVLTSDENRWLLNTNDETGVAAPASFAGFWWLGVEHILSGWDHLAFVLGLILLAASLKQVAWLVTGFTVAHSLTLALAVLGWVQPAGHAVEALIALSILLIAIEAAWQLAGRDAVLPILVVVGLLGFAALQPQGLPVLTLIGMAIFSFCYFRLLGSTQQPHRIRALVAFGFGLFHGFGFAGILAEMDLSSTNLTMALLGFNLGVESGQLLVIAIIWPLLLWLSARSDLLPRVCT
ncbi:MAG: HupE/UreJ family protein, partial [Salinisphaeraceae bacterium]|nr:HupE/UreJ family protein [Salinisphaeraceae bacterium]